MEDVQELIKKWIADIDCDINAEWNNDKLKNSIQVFKLEQALFLLQSVGQNDNIPS